jgi:hypothetical protein
MGYIVKQIKDWNIRLELDKLEAELNDLVDKGYDITNIFFYEQKSPVWPVFFIIAKKDGEE